MSTPATTPSSRRGQIMQTYQMAKRSDPRLGSDPPRRLRGRRRRRLRRDLAPPGRRLALVGHGDRRRHPGRLARRAASSSVAAPSRRRTSRWRASPAAGCRCAADAEARLEGRPGRRLHQAAGRRPPRRRPARHRPGRRGQAQTRVKALLATERRKHERVVSGTPIHEVICRPRRGRGAAAQARPPRHQARPQRASRPRSPTSCTASRPSTPPAARSRSPRVRCPTTMKGMRAQQRGR